MSIEFQHNVYKIVRLIPKGRVCSYGVIGKALGMPNSARMVGKIISKSHQQTQYIPAHRVVNSMGLLTGKHHFTTSTQMQELLEAEGIKIKNDKVVNFKTHFWNPLIELNFD